jgi:uncharacterized protein YbjT (DUF2867 family)
MVAVSRAPANDPAAALSRAGAEVVRGDLLDLTSVRNAFKGAYGVFGVTQPWSPDYRTADVASEIRQGQHIVDASVVAEVRHLVLSTALRPESGLSGMPHVDSKIEIETYARAAKVPMTIMRPAQFMDNIGSRFFPVRPWRVRGFVDADAKVPYIACADIGALVSVAFVRPREFVGGEINAVGDFVSGLDIADILTRLHGQRFRYSATPAWLMWVFAREFYAMRRTFEQYGRRPYPPQFCEVFGRNASPLAGHPDNGAVSAATGQATNHPKRLGILSGGRPARRHHLSVDSTFGQNQLSWLGG